MGNSVSDVAGDMMRNFMAVFSFFFIIFAVLLYEQLDPELRDEAPI